MFEAGADVSYFKTFYLRLNFLQSAWSTLLNGIRILPHTKENIFISYAWDNPVNATMQRWLEELQQGLQAAGFRAFLDLSDMHDHLRDLMQSEIQSSSAAIIVCTPRYKLRSEQIDSNVSFELNCILDRKATLSATYQIIPLLYSGDFSTSVPSLLGISYLIRDCTNRSRFASQLINLINPLGIIPALLGIRVGDQSGYEQLLYDYRLASLPNLPRRNIHFSGRLSKLADIDSGFQRNSVQVIAGLGGMGKTQLAMHWAHAHQDQYDICRWIMSEGGQLSSSIRQFAEDAGIDPNGREEAEVVRRLFEYLRNLRWLLVFDNVEDAAAINAYLPQADRLGPNQHILITSRSQAWHNAGVLCLIEFEPEEAIAYVNEHMQEDDQESVESLVNAMGRLPLALSQAVAFIGETGVTVSMYLELLAENPSSALREIDAAHSYPHTVFSTLMLSIVRIQQHPNALRLLRACAWLDADAIPLSLFENPNLLNCQRAEVYEALRILRGYSMVEVIRSGYIKIHRLVQMVLQDEADSQSSLIAVTESLISSYRWFKQTETDFANTRELLGHHDIVRKHLHSVMIREQSPAEWTARYVTITRQLGDSYRVLGNAVKKRDLLQQALPIAEAHFGPNNIAVAQILTSLGNTWGDLGYAGTERDMQARALRIKEAHYGTTDHIEVAFTMSNLGNAYGSLGNFLTERDLQISALAILERHLDRDDAEIGTTLRHLGWAQRRLGEFDQALQSFKRSLDIYSMERNMGPNHPDTALAMSDVASTYGCLGQYHKAREMLERALRVFEMAHGPEHFTMGSILQDLGNVYGRLDNNERQRECLERAFNIQEAHYGSDHVMMIFILKDLAEMHGASGEATEQRDLLHRALQIQERGDGDRHYAVSRLHILLGNSYATNGDNTSALESLGRALNSMSTYTWNEYTWNEDIIHVIEVLIDLAVAYCMIGEAEVQRELLDRAFQFLGGDDGRSYYLHVVQLWRRLADEYGKLGDTGTQHDCMGAAAGAEYFRRA
jgi:tetratricopeptide (TPR) repeat protein